MRIMFKWGEFQVKKGERARGFLGTRVAKNKGARKPGVSKIGPRGKV